MITTTIGLCALGMLSFACADASEPAEGALARLEIVAGADQVAPPGSQLPEPIAVRVLDGRDQPVPGRVVAFEVLAGGGSLAAGVARTGSDGLARDRWTLGPAAGDQVLGASVAAGADGGVFLSAVVRATATGSGTGAPVPPITSAERVAFPSEVHEMIMGPQLRSGSAPVPWSWFDENASATGHEHGADLPDAFGADESEGRQYYDQALVQYINYYRTGDERFRGYARRAADAWWKHPAIDEGRHDPSDNSLAPRQASLGGLMLRAMDGRPEMWEWVTRWTRYHHDLWVGNRLSTGELYYGAREGGYALLYTAWLARAHPDEGVRSEMRTKAVRAARWIAGLQYPDGSWRWREEPGSAEVPKMLPFHVGILLEGLIAAHQLDGDGKVQQAILDSVENLWTVGYRRPDQDTDSPRHRAFWYLVYGTGCQPPEPDPRDVDAGGCATAQWGVEAERQNNTLLLHAFGYAHHLTGEAKYRTWGDEVFDATFGGSDGQRATVDYRAKEYSQGYRTGGRYLAWRSGR